MILRAILSPKSTVARFVNQVGTYGLGAVITPLVSALLVPVYARFLTTGDFGELAIIEIIQGFLGLVIGLRLQDSVLRVYHAYDSPDDRDAVLSTCMLTSIATSATFVVLFLSLNAMVDIAGFVGVRRPGAYNLMLLSLIPSIGRVVILSGLRAQQRARLYVTITLVSIVCGLIAKILFVAVWNQGVIGALRGGLVGGTVSMAFALGVTSIGQYRWKWKCCN